MIKPIVKPLTATLSLLTLCIATIAYACQVPVFRYALERWPADNYEIVVLHDRPLTAADEIRVGKLREWDRQSPQSSNFQFRSVQVGQPDDKRGMTQRDREIWKAHGKPKSPILAVLYPSTAAEVPDRLIHAGPLRDLPLDSVVDSPLRRTIADRLISGESAVWIFVPSGNQEQDAAAYKRLTDQVAINEATLELPEQEEIVEEEAILEQVEIELRLDFSIVTLNRDDPKEQFLLKMLLGSEEDLNSIQQPMAFPVLGRGRVLYALVGKGINEETIGLASRFMIGPCSCQVKNQNPGFDLLMTYPWDEKIGAAKLSDPIPEVTGEPVLLTIPPGKSARP
ncbi:MAG: hypothetical protein HKN47_04980 [Pirellulaceae bacterium]|nr:hypothetical protein [Pirellulaceae bacterium]